jgi:hypothetical protein
MKPIIKTLALCALLASAATADVTVTVKASSPWLGFMNVFELPSNGGGYVFGQPWGTADLRAVFSGSTLTLSPNTINDPNAFWYTPSGGPGAAGNKIMDASLYIQPPDGTYSGQTMTFTGNVSANTLTGAHTTVAFIKDFAPDYSSFVSSVVALEPGPFEISLALNSDPLRHVQYGFQTIGVNVWATDVAPFGSVKVDVINIPPGNPNVTVDPGAAWQGFLNVFDLAPPNAFLVGNPWATRDLAAVFSGPKLTLRPNSIDDANYYDDGVGIRRMEANMYVESPKGTLAGQTVNFSGNVAANSLSGTHTTVAFIKDFSADYSTSVTVTAPLTAGAFNISLPTIADTSRHVQYGFQVVGPPVPIESIGSFGSVEIDTNRTNSFATWMSGFDFSNFVTPNLTQSGDPDGDGQNNFAEFALNSDPTSGAASGKFRSEIGPVGVNQAMLMTMPVFNGAVFSGTPAQTATSGQISYTIQGSNNLAAFDQPVSEVIPAMAEGLPTLGAGWDYRTFRLDGAVGGGSPRGPVGFLRARTAPAP